MPLVLSQKAKQVFSVRNEEWLGEILGHSNFDGAGWAVGDLIVFENGTAAEIEQVPDDKFHIWSEPKAANLTAVIKQVSKLVPDSPSFDQGISDWPQFFEKAGSLASRRFA